MWTFLSVFILDQLCFSLKLAGFETLLSSERDLQTDVEVYTEVSPRAARGSIRVEDVSPQHPHQWSDLPGRPEDGEMVSVSCQSWAKLNKKLT